ncbi:hypothetical protein ASG33_18185 [Dyadobacter sp. Leaf189]|nr:hypothetical protein ASG33_18185 [Dyadobacter sp. Leaf189]
MFPYKLPDNFNSVTPIGQNFLTLNFRFHTNKIGRGECDPRRLFHVFEKTAGKITAYRQDLTEK